MWMRNSLHLRWWRRWTCHYRIPMSSSKSQLPLPYHLRRSRSSRLQSLSTVIQSLRVAPRKKDSKPSNVIRLKSRSCSDKIRFIVSASLRHSRRRLLSRPKSKYTKKRNKSPTLLDNSWKLKCREKFIIQILRIREVSMHFKWIFLFLKDIWM